MKNSVTRLFVYGTLRRGFHHPAFEYISKHFHFVGIAKTRGRLYDMGEYPAAVATLDDAFIVGELYEVKQQDEFEWAIEQLDDYEGLNPEEGESELYKRELTEVFYGDASATAWMYWYSTDPSRQPLIPSGDVFDHPAYQVNI